MAPALLDRGRRVVRVAAALVAVVLAGCASVTTPPPTASGELVAQLRSAGLVPAALGDFVLAPGRPPALDTDLSGLRGSTLSPLGGRFSAQLKTELMTQLQAAGLYDPASDAVISGQLTDSRVDAAIGTGTGRVAAHFVVRRRGQVVFDRELAAEANWDSSFMGAVAIPRAMSEYTALYRKLVAALVNDADFRRAMAR